MLVVVLGGQFVGLPILAVLVLYLYASQWWRRKQGKPHIQRRTWYYIFGMLGIYIISPIMALAVTMVDSEVPLGMVLSIFFFISFFIVLKTSDYVLQNNLRAFLVLSFFVTIALYSTATFCSDHVFNMRYNLSLIAIAALQWFNIKYYLARQTPKVKT